MTKAVNVLYPLIERIIPEYIKTEYVNIKNLILDYFKWLESNNGFMRVLLDFQESQDISNEIEPYIDWYLHELGWDYTKPIYIDKKQLILALKNFYLSRGSAKSYSFLFKVLYGVDCTIGYPRDSMFVLSNSLYTQDCFLMITANNFNTTAYNEIFNSTFFSAQIKGLKTNSTALINSFTQVIKNGKFYVLLNIDVPDRMIFETNVTIVITDYNQTTIQEIALDVVKIDITNVGQGYLIGDIIRISDCTFEGLLKVKKTTKGYVQSVNIINAGQGYVVGDFIITDSTDGQGFIATVTSVDNLGAIETIRIYNQGRDYSIYPSLKIKTKLGINAILEPIGNNIGGIETIDYIEYYYQLNSNTPTITIESLNGNSAVLSLNIKNCLANENFSFKNQNGFISTNNAKITDSYFNQQFSYSLTSEIPSLEYAPMVDKFLHPIGFVRYNILSILDDTTQLIQNTIDDFELSLIKNLDLPDIQFITLTNNVEIILEIESELGTGIGINILDLYKNDVLFDTPIYKFDMESITTIYSTNVFNNMGYALDAEINSITI